MAVSNIFFFVSTPIWGRFPFWLIFFKWVETTNQLSIADSCGILHPSATARLLTASKLLPVRNEESVCLISITGLLRVKKKVQNELQTRDLLWEVATCNPCQTLGLEGSCGRLGRLRTRCKSHFGNAEPFVLQIYVKPRLAMLASWTSRHVSKRQHDDAHWNHRSDTLLRSDDRSVGPC